MTQATLSLNGFPPINGSVETGGDYARFRTQATPQVDSAEGTRDGQLLIDGKPERVVMENCRPLSADEGGGCEITLRRINPGA